MDIFDNLVVPDHFNDDIQQHYLDELRDILNGDCDKQITEDHIQALIAEKEMQGE